MHRYSFDEHRQAAALVNPRLIPRSAALPVASGVGCFDPAKRFRVIWTEGVFLVYDAALPAPLP